VWITSIVPRLHRQPLGSIARESLEYALLAWAWGAATALALHFTMPRPVRRETLAGAIRTSTTAVWFAPATILLSSFSPSALIAALVLVVSATRLLYDEWRRLYGDAEWRGGFAPSLTISFSFQCGLWALLAGYPLGGAALFALSTAMLTLFSILTGAWEQKRSVSLPRSIFAAMLTVLLATGLTVGGLTRYLDGAPDLSVRERPGLLSMLRALLGKTFYYGDGPPGEEEHPLMTTYLPQRETEVNDDTFPGVILWPETKPHATLVDPLPAMAPGPGAILPVDLLSIPFSGEYWMYKAPQVKPPPQSLFRRGNPVEFSYKTTDRRPMNMVARHRLERPVKTSCCASIRVSVLNADRYPGTVTLELILLNSHSTVVPMQSLGRVRVASRPEGLPAAEVLEFPMPANPAIREFDEFYVVFHRERHRNYRSAKVSLEHFVLVPKGARAAVSPAHMAGGVQSPSSPS
jgi:hypothetical protein